MKVAIIGAGPSGCYAGYLLAQSGHQVSIYEKKAQIGTPIQCTGIFSFDFEQFNFPLEPFLVNTINQTEVYFPNKEKVTVAQKNYVVCREKFDNYLTDLAQKKGARIFLNHSFVRKKGDNLIIRDLVNKQEKIIAPDIIIAADGPLSPTAKAYGFYHPQRKNYYGIQAVVEGEFDPNLVQTFFGNEVCPNLFVWIVPESSTIARVGLAATKNSQHYFDQFMKEHNFTVLEKQGGIVPLYHPQQKLKQDNCYLLGDAAGFVKATTLGGVVPGLKQAEILVDCLNHGKDYEEEIIPLARKLRLHLKVRKVLDKFSDQDWNKFASYVSQEKVQKVLGKYARDNPLPLIGNLLLKEPRFLGFVKYLF